jgi:hypothetical protein
VIYVYRPKSFIGGGVQPKVSCGQESVSLAPGGYHPYVVDPGTVTCRASTESTAEVDVKSVAGEPSYVKEEIGAGVLVGHPHLYLVDTNSGETEAGKCKRQD